MRKLNAALRVVVTSSYEALGLVASLHPTASGGVERPLGGPSKSEPSVPAASAPAQASSGSSTSGLRKGFGRIVRDADGNVVDVQLAEADEEELQQQTLAARRETLVELASER